MRRLILALVAIGMLGITPGSASAQSFDEMPGLEQVVVRAWIAPSTETLVETTGGTNEQGTPISEVTTVTTTATPEATPDPATFSAVVFLSIGIFDFDSVENATTGYEAFAATITDVSASDPQFADGELTTLDNLGDQATHAVAGYVEDDIPFSLVFTVVQDGERLYLFQGTLVRLDGTAEVERMAQAMIAADAGDTEPAFDANGASTGGVWDLYAGVEPVLLDGSQVSDTIVFPIPES